MGLGETSQVQPSCLIRSGGGLLNQTKRPSDRCVRRGYVRKRLLGAPRKMKEKSVEGLFWTLAESDCREPASVSGASPLTRQNGESQMTKMKTLSALIFLSAAVATPVFAQDAGVRGPGTRYGLEPHRGAYNQLNGPSYATPWTAKGRNIENVGSDRSDPSRAGGQDPSFTPSGS
jgi:hypothetical protein